MKIEDIKIDSAVMITKMVGGKDGIVAPVVSIKGSWVTLLEGDITYKMRAKDLELVVDKMEIGDDGVDPDEDVAIDDTQAQEVNDAQGDDFTRYCSDCDKEFIARSAGSVQCPRCGAWIYVKLPFNKDNFTTGLAVTESGRDTVDINDAVAGSLRGKKIEEMIAVTADYIGSKPYDCWFSVVMFKSHTLYCEKNSMDPIDPCGLEEYFTDKYAHLNNGMVRMNLGNVFRGCANRYSKHTDTIVVHYEASDGHSQVKPFKSLHLAAKYAVNMVGASPEIGKDYAISADGVGRVACEGTIDGRDITVQNLFE